MGQRFNDSLGRSIDPDHPDWLFDSLAADVITRGRKITEPGYREGIESAHDRWQAALDRARAYKAGEPAPAKRKTIVARVPGKGRWYVVDAETGEKLADAPSEKAARILARRY